MIERRTYAEGVTIAAHISVGLKRDLADLAHEHRRSLSAEARKAIEHHLAAARKGAVANQL